MFSSVDRRLSDVELSFALMVKEVNPFNMIGELDSFVVSYNNISDAYISQFNRVQEAFFRDPSTDYQGRSISSPGLRIHPVEILALEDLKEHLLHCLRNGMPLAAEVHREMIAVLERNFGRRVEFVEDPEMPGHVSFAQRSEP